MTAVSDWLARNASGPLLLLSISVGVCLVGFLGWILRGVTTGEESPSRTSPQVRFDGTPAIEQVFADNRAYRLWEWNAANREVSGRCRSQERQHVSALRVELIPPQAVPVTPTEREMP